MAAANWAGMARCAVRAAFSGAIGTGIRTSSSIRSDRWTRSGTAQRANQRAIYQVKKDLSFWGSLLQRNRHMADTPEVRRPNATGRRYRWPWYVLAAFILAIILAVVWLSFEIRRTQRIREINTAMPQPVR